MTTLHFPPMMTNCPNPKVEGFVRDVRAQVDAAFGHEHAEPLAREILDLAPYIDECIRRDAAALETDDYRKVADARLRIGTLHLLLDELTAPIASAHNALAEKELLLRTKRIDGMEREQ